MVFVTLCVRCCNRQELARHTRGDDVMLQMGGDFGFENANAWFKNLDLLIEATNKEGRINVSSAGLSDVCYQYVTFPCCDIVLCFCTFFSLLRTSYFRLCFPALLEFSHFTFRALFPNRSCSQGSSYSYICSSDARRSLPYFVLGQAFYSTPEQYTRAKHDSELEWSVKTDDFFPYADCPVRNNVSATQHS